MAPLLVEHPRPQRQPQMGSYGAFHVIVLEAGSGLEALDSGNFENLSAKVSP